MNRTPCPVGAEFCASMQCDGNDRTACRAPAVAAGVECEPASCINEAKPKVQPRSTCNGAGSCVTPAVQECGNYACEAGSCKTKCTQSSDCALGFFCASDGRCVEGARCSDDKLSSIAKGGTITQCAPYRCGDLGLCDDKCSSTDNCAPGSVCDTTTKTCLADTTAEDDSGGCGGCATGGNVPRRAVLASIAALALAFARRRGAARR